MVTTRASSSKEEQQRHDHDSSSGLLRCACGRRDCSRKTNDGLLVQAKQQLARRHQQRRMARCKPRHVGNGSIRDIAGMTDEAYYHLGIDGDRMLERSRLELNTFPPDANAGEAPYLPKSSAARMEASAWGPGDEILIRLRIQQAPSLSARLARRGRAKPHSPIDDMLGGLSRSAELGALRSMGGTERRNRFDRIDEVYFVAHSHSS